MGFELAIAVGFVLGSNRALLDQHQHPLRNLSAAMAPSEEVVRATHVHTHITKTTRTINTLNAPPVATPPRSATPPLIPENIQANNRSNGQTGLRNDRSSSSSVANLIDPNALKNALKEYEDAGRHRDVTPGGSPSRKRQRIYGDR